MGLDGFREKYGDKHLKCDECGATRKMSDIIDQFEDENTEVLFHPEKISDLLYTNCYECGALRLHELIDTTEPEEESNGQSKPESNADGQSEPSDNKSTGSDKPFSI